MAKKYLAMYISITQLKLKSLSKFFTFFIYNARVVKQLKNAPGLVQQKMFASNLYTYWTFTAWEDKESMLSFRNSGPHLEAMKNISKIAKKAKAGGWESNEIPDTKQAMQKIDSHAPGKQS